MKKVYYSHDIWKYRTDIEIYETMRIREVFADYNIINPTTLIHQDPIDDKGIKLDRLKEISRCNILVFSSMSGVVGSDVYEEVNYALDNNILVYYMINNGFLHIPNLFWSLIGHSDRVYAKVNLEGKVYD